MRGEDSGEGWGYLRLIQRRYVRFDEDKECKQRLEVSSNALKTVAVHDLVGKHGLRRDMHLKGKGGEK